MRVYTQEKWTAEAVIEELDSAGKTEALERIGGLRPRGYMAFWPEIVPEKGLDYVEAEPVWISPSPKAISQNRMALEWMANLALYCNSRQIPHVRNAVGMRHEYRRCRDTGKLYPAYGHNGEKSWRALGRKLGCDKNTAERWYEDGIRILVRLLNEGRR